ncbi:hypothetical protein BG841_01925 [Marinobacter sp. X15-166B]|nr:hypothetical protein BG841_01925 [Marinobacter sp. X15-166B]
MQIAYRAQDLTEAHIVAGMLRTKGIAAHVSGHYLQGALGEIGAGEFTNVMVDDVDLKQARALIDEYEGEPRTAPGRASGDPRIDDYALGFLLVVLVTLALLVLLV